MKFYIKNPTWNTIFGDRTCEISHQFSTAIFILKKKIIDNGFLQIYQKNTSGAYAEDLVVSNPINRGLSEKYSEKHEIFEKLVIIVSAQ